MEELALIKPNRMAFIMNAVICFTLTAGYLLDLLKGRKTLGFVLIFLSFIFLELIVCSVVYMRNKKSNHFKYFILAGYTIVYYFAIFSSDTYFTYVFIFPITVLYVLYYNFKLMKIIGFVTVISNIAKIVFQVYHGHTSSDDITSYTVQMAFVILVSIGLYLGAKHTVDINNEKVLKVLEYSKLLEENTNILSGSINEQLGKTQDIVNFTVHIKDLSEEMIEISKNTSSTLDFEMKNLLQLQNETVKLNERSTNVYTEIKQLNSIAKTITETVKIISEIAFNTDILAINASIEAVRTGSQNRGFTVVANEVKRLASQSNESANTITEIIGGLLEKVTHTLKEVNYLVESNASQNKVISLVESTCEDIAGKINNLSEKIRTLDVELNNLSQANQDIAAGTQKLTDIAERSQTMQPEIRL